MATGGQAQNRLGEEEDANANNNGKPTPTEGINVPLFDASKMGFNDRAWNDPPFLLLNTSVVVGTPPKPKLTSRVAFPLDFAQQQAAAPATTNLNPNAPPPMTGFVKSDIITTNSTDTKSSETDNAKAT